MGSYLFPLIAVLIWSVNTVVSKMAADSIGAAEIGFYRWLVAAVLFTPFLCRPSGASAPTSGRSCRASSCWGCWAW